LVRQHSQFVIATHSPILLAYPHARIYEFSDRGLKEVVYEDTEHFRVTRDFLTNPARMMELLLREDENAE
jgi:predicted ATPase